MQFHFLVNIEMLSLVHVAVFMGLFFPKHDLFYALNDQDLYGGCLSIVDTNISSFFFFFLALLFKAISILLVNILSQLIICARLFKK